MIDQNGQRFLLSNTIGQLYLMVLISDESGFLSKVVDLRFEYLGDTSIAHSITYIDNGHVFIGSKLGDSQLIKVKELKTNSNNTTTKYIFQVTTAHNDNSNQVLCSSE